MIPASTSTSLETDLHGAVVVAGWGPYRLAFMRRFQRNLPLSRSREESLLRELIEAVRQSALDPNPAAMQRYRMTGKHGRGLWRARKEAHWRLFFHYDRESLRMTFLDFAGKHQVTQVIGTKEVMDDYDQQLQEDLERQPQTLLTEPFEIERLVERLFRNELSAELERNEALLDALREGLLRPLAGARTLEQLASLIRYASELEHPSLGRLETHWRQWLETSSASLEPSLQQFWQEWEPVQTQIQVLIRSAFSAEAIPSGALLSEIRRTFIAAAIRQEIDTRLEAWARAYLGHVSRATSELIPVAMEDVRQVYEAVYSGADDDSDVEDVVVDIVALLPSPEPPKHTRASEPDNVSAVAAEGDRGRAEDLPAVLPRVTAPTSPQTSGSASAPSLTVVIRRRRSPKRMPQPEEAERLVTPPAASRWASASGARARRLLPHALRAAPFAAAIAAVWMAFVWRPEMAKGAGILVGAVIGAAAMALRELHPSIRTFLGKPASDRISDPPASLAPSARAAPTRRVLLKLSAGLILPAIAGEATLRLAMVNRDRIRTQALETLLSLPPAEAFDLALAKLATELEDGGYQRPARGLRKLAGSAVATNEGRTPRPRIRYSPERGVYALIDVAFLERHVFPEVRRLLTRRDLRNAERCITLLQVLALQNTYYFVFEPGKGPAPVLFDLNERYLRAQNEHERLLLARAYLAVSIDGVVTSAAPGVVYLQWKGVSATDLEALTAALDPTSPFRAFMDVYIRGFKADGDLYLDSLKPATREQLRRKVFGDLLFAADQTDTVLEMKKRIMQDEIAHGRMKLSSDEKQLDVRADGLAFLDDPAYLRGSVSALRE